MPNHAIWHDVRLACAFHRVEEVIRDFMGMLSLSIFTLAAFFFGRKLKATEKGTLSGDVAREMLVVGATALVSAGRRCRGTTRRYP